MSEIDLSSWKDSEELLEALEQARQLGRRDLRNDVIALLDHDDPVVREEALSLLLVTWKDPEAREAAVRALASRTEDFGVRTRAAVGLAAVSNAATRAEDIKALLAAALDRSEDGSVRRAAYEALLLLHGKSPPPVNRPFSVDSDADHEWLAELQARHSG